MIETKPISGIDLNSNKQIELVKILSTYYGKMPFTPERQSRLRYNFENQWYSYTDAIMLYCMIRHFTPQRIIEVGSGFSSALMLDVNELFFDRKIELTFIEPEPSRLMKLLTASDGFHLFGETVQKVALSEFEKLEKNDILFIDGSHIFSPGSDVEFILYHVLPILKPGVIIHFHDISFPFEYASWVPKEWNEAQALKLFLMYNTQFEILIFSDYLHKNHGGIFAQMPLAYKNTGANIWLVKK